jgi:hypothetical protein
MLILGHELWKEIFGRISSQYEMIVVMEDVLSDFLLLPHTARILSGDVCAMDRYQQFIWNMNEHKIKKLHLIQHCRNSACGRWVTHWCAHSLFLDISGTTLHSSNTQTPLWFIEAWDYDRNITCKELWLLASRKTLLSSWNDVCGEAQVGVVNDGRGEQYSSIWSDSNGQERIDV